MPIFRDAGSGLAGLKEKPFTTEREIQILVEANLGELLGLKFVASQFAPRGDLRIDTLAFDSNQKSLVIIEYKKGTNWSVMDQGFSYLSLLLDRKADFILRLNEKHSICLNKWRVAAAQQDCPRCESLPRPRVASRKR